MSGDTGSPIPPEHLDALRGNVDILLALAGAHATIGYHDLDAAIRAIVPRMIIPMHYYSPRGWLQIESVDAFVSCYPNDMITRVGGSHLEITPATLPMKQHIFVLDQSR